MVLVALLSLGAGAAFWRSVQKPENPWADQVLLSLPEPRVIADFRLTDHRGKPFSLSGLQGRWTMMFVGFTSCPDVCPGTLYLLHQVNETLARELTAAERPQIVFLSVDPERDSIEKLAVYLEHFDPEFIGVTGEHAQLLPLTMQMGIAYHIEDHEAGEMQYGVEHSAGILLINPDGRVHGLFPAPHQAEAVADSVIDTVSG
jgi:protein SCO1/2